MTIDRTTMEPKDVLGIAMETFCSRGWYDAAAAACRLAVVLAQAAAHLFEALHNADASLASAIAVAPIPHEGIGIAMNDRLTRAAVR